MKKSTTKEDLLQQDHVQAKVKERAYHIAQSEGFPHGRDAIHWLQAEEQIIVEFLGDKWDATVRAAKKLTGKKEAAKAAPKPAVKAESSKQAAPKAPAKKAPASASKSGAASGGKAGAKTVAKASAKPATKPAAKKAPAKPSKKS